jgi:hypothetical protein
MKMAVFWAVAACGMVQVHWRYEDATNQKKTIRKIYNVYVKHVPIG